MFVLCMSVRKKESTKEKRKKTSFYRKGLISSHLSVFALSSSHGILALCALICGAVTEA